MRGSESSTGAPATIPQTSSPCGGRHGRSFGIMCRASWEEQTAGRARPRKARNIGFPFHHRARRNERTDKERGASERRTGSFSGSRLSRVLRVLSPYSLPPLATGGSSSIVGFAAVKTLFLPPAAAAATRGRVRPAGWQSSHGAIAMPCYQEKVSSGSANPSYRRRLPSL